MCNWTLAAAWTELDWQWWAAAVEADPSEPRTYEEGA